MSDRRRFGLIGAGTMGKGLGRNLIRRGFAVAAVDPDPERMAFIRSLGAAEANGVAGLAASSDVIGACLPSLAAIREAFEGPDGIIANARPGSVVVDFSTSDPRLTRELGAKAAERSIAMIDAPMLRMERHAWEGELVLLVGGEADTVAGCAAVFEAVSERFIHCGPLGSGHTFKLLNNVSGLAMHAAYCESFTLGRKLGVDLDLLLEVIRSGMAGSTILDATSHRVVTGEEGQLFATDTALKDVTLFTRLAEDMGSPAPVAAGARSAYQLTSLMGYGGDDIVNIGAALERLAGADEK